MKKVTKFGLEVLTGKALSFLLEFIDKTGEKAKQTPSKVLFVAKKKRRPRPFGHRAPKL